MVISLPAIWKVWVVSHYLSASAYTSMPLVAPLGSKHMSGSKPVTFTKALGLGRQSLIL